MAPTIIVQATDVWRYFHAHSNELKLHEMLVAENEGYGVQIFISAIDDTLGDDAVVIVKADGEEVFSEMLFDKADCDSTMREIYETYLSDSVVNTLITSGVYDYVDKAEELDDDFADELIDTRELEIDDAIYDLLAILAPEIDISEIDINEVIDGLKDTICEYLYKEHQVSVYRPMILEDEDGSDYFTEYPYPEMELDE